MELTENRINGLTCPEVKTGLLQFNKALTDIKNNAWTAARGLKQAVDNIDKEVKYIYDENGEKVTDNKGEFETRPRFKSKSAFYQWVGYKDSNASQLITAVEFNDNFSIDGVTLEQAGVSVRKVYTLASKVGNDDLMEFLTYAFDVLHSKDLNALARVSDKSLIDLVDAWKQEAGKEVKKQSTKQEATKQEATKQEATKQEATKQEATEQEATEQEATATEQEATETTEQPPMMVLYQSLTQLYDDVEVGCVDLVAVTCGTDTAHAKRVINMICDRYGIKKIK